MELCESDYYIVYRRKFSRIKNRPKRFVKKRQGYYRLIALKYCITNNDHYEEYVYIQKIVSFKRFIKGRK